MAATIRQRCEDLLTQVHRHMKSVESGWSDLSDPETGKKHLEALLSLHMATLEMVRDLASADQ